MKLDSEDEPLEPAGRMSGESFSTLPVPVVGLTGGIAVGKSLVRDLFAARGIPHVDADRVARQVVAAGTIGLERVLEAFGDGYRLADGSLNRARLGAHVFQDETARGRLNAILHPLIAQRSLFLLRELAITAPAYLLYEAALLVENDSYRSFSALIVVAASRAVQRRRLMDRDGLSATEAEERLRSQLPLEDKMAVADFVIHNDGPLKATEDAVNEVDSALRKRFMKGLSP